MNNLHTLLEHLRTLDDRTKQTWVFVLSGVTMLFVLILWVSYLNATLVPVPPSQLQLERMTQTEKELPVTDSHSPLANFKRNTSQIYENLKTRFFGFTKKSREIDIEK